MPGGVLRTVVLDASVLINLIHAGRLDVLGGIEGYEFVVPGQVVELEVTYREQAEALAVALDRGWLRREDGTDTGEIALYAGLLAVMGRGEAACLSMAEHRGWLVGCDEGGVFRREAFARVGRERVVNTPGLLVLAIRQGKLSVAEADAIKELLESRRYRMPFRSFGELVE